MNGKNGNWFLFNNYYNDLVCVEYQKLPSDTYISNNEKTICITSKEATNYNIINVAVINTSPNQYLPQFTISSFVKGSNDSNIFITIKNRYKDDTTVSIQICILYTKWYIQK